MLYSWSRAGAKSGLIVLLVLFLPIGALAQAQAEVDEPIQLKGKIKRTLDESVIPALNVDHPTAFLSAFVPLIDSAKPETVAKIEKYCLQQSGYSAKEYFVNLVLSYAQQGITPEEIIKNKTLGQYVVTGLIDRVSDFADVTEKHTVLDEGSVVPDDWNKSEKLFWDIHVLSNEFANISRLVEFGDSIVLSSRLRRSDEGKALSAEIERLRERVDRTWVKLEERFAELRLQRFENSFEKLKSNGNFKTMLTATMSLALDGELLLAYLADKGQVTFGRDALNQEGLHDEIKNKLNEGIELAGAVATKAGLLRNGLHYWLRGRYGAGPMAFGLLKHPSALNSRFAMEVLSMPKDRPMPISAYHNSEESSEGYERRHYYTWALENRTVLYSQQDTTESASYRANGRQSTSSRFL